MRKPWVCVQFTIRKKSVSPGISVHYFAGVSLVHTLRYQLKQQGIHLSWDSIRHIMSTQQGRLKYIIFNDLLLNLMTLVCVRFTIRKKSVSPGISVHYFAGVSLVHTLRYQLKQQGIHLSWDSIRHIMSTQQRMTIILPTDHKVIHLRTTAKAEVRQKQIYDALNIKPDLIGKCKTMIDRKKSVVPIESV